MSQEIIYTSAPKGLKLGSRGFCTVVSTAGMSKSLAERLESLSGYRHIFPPQDAQAHLNPVAYSCVTTQVGGMTFYIVSRVADAGIDYSGRTNKLAHHLALTAAELAPAGPAWLAAQPGVLQTTFTGEPRVLPQGRPIPRGELAPRVCTAWQQATGDAGWAGVLAHTIAEGPRREACLVFRPGMQLLPLIEEAQALLPAELRWQATFSTYFTKLPPGVTCRWRCVLEGSEEEAAARRSPHVLVIDLCQPLGAPPASPHVEAARAGTTIRFAAAPGIPTLHATDAAHTTPATHASPESHRLEPAPPQLPPTVPPRGAPPLRIDDVSWSRRNQHRRRRSPVLWLMFIGLLLGAGSTGAVLYFTKPEVGVAAAPENAEPVEEVTEKADKKEKPKATEVPKVEGAPDASPVQPPSDGEGSAGADGSQNSANEATPKVSDAAASDAEESVPMVAASTPNANDASVNEEQPSDAPQPKNATSATPDLPANEQPQPPATPAPQKDKPKEQPKVEPQEKPAATARKMNPFPNLPWGLPLPERVTYRGGVAPQTANVSAELTVLASPSEIHLDIVPLFGQSKAYRVEHSGGGKHEAIWNVLTANSPPDTSPPIARFLIRRTGQEQSIVQFEWGTAPSGLSRSASVDYPMDLMRFALHLKVTNADAAPIIPLRPVPVFRPSPLKLTQLTYESSVTLEGLPADKGIHYSIIAERNTLPASLSPINKDGTVTIPFGPAHKDNKRNLQMEYRLNIKIDGQTAVKGSVYVANPTSSLETQTLRHLLSNSSRSDLSTRITTLDKRIHEENKTKLPHTEGDARKRVEGAIKELEDEKAYLTFLTTVIDVRSRFDHEVHCRVVVPNPVVENGPPVTVALIGDYPETQQVGAAQ